MRRAVLIAGLVAASACTSSPVRTSPALSPTNGHPTASATPSQSALSREVALLFMAEDATPPAKQARLLLWDPRAGTVRLHPTPLFRTTVDHEVSRESLAPYWLWDGQRVLEVIEMVVEPADLPPSIPPVDPVAARTPVGTVVVVHPFGGLYDGRRDVSVEDRGSDPPVLVVDDRHGGRRSAQAPEEFRGTTGWAPLVVLEQGDAIRVLFQYHHPIVAGSGEMVCSLGVLRLSTAIAAWKAIPGNGVCDLNNPQAVRIGNQIYVISLLQRGALTIVDTETWVIAGSLTRGDYLRFEHRFGATSAELHGDGSGYASIGTWGDLLLVTYVANQSEDIVWALRGGEPVGALLIDTARGRIRSRGGARATELESVRWLTRGSVPCLPRAG